jgi:hypothetical protein
MSTVPSALPPKKPAGKGLGAWFTGHKTQAYIGAAGLVITIALYVKSKDSASATSAGTTDSTAVPTSTADTTGTDAYNGIEDQVLGLQSALLGLQTGSASTTSSVGTTSSSDPGQPVSTSPSVATSPALQPQTIAALTAANLDAGQNPTQAGNNAAATVGAEGAYQEQGQTPAQAQQSVASEVSASQSALAQFGW